MKNLTITARLLDKMKKLSIVMPCYNEAENIPLIIEKLIKVKEKFKPLEVILVDNGSTDNSKEVLKNILIKQIYHSLKFSQLKNEGYGHGILCGLKVATGDYLAWTHADLQTDSYDVIKAYEKLTSEKDPENFIVKGRRKKRNFFDTFFTFGMSIFSSAVLRTWLSDVNAQPKVFSRRIYNKMRNPPKDFSLDLYLLFLAKEKGIKIETIPVYFNERLYGEAKGGGSIKTKWKLIKRTFKYILELQR